jgi:hypothetical protein
MRDLARFSYCCFLRKPNEAISASEEEIFEQSNYNRIFPKEKIVIEDDRNRMVYDYLLVWRLSKMLEYVKLNEKDIFYYKSGSYYYALLHAYDISVKLREKLHVRDDFFLEFIESNLFENFMLKIFKTYFKRYPVVLLTKKEKTDARKYFRNIKTLEKFDEKFKVSNSDIRNLSRIYSRFEKN